MPELTPERWRELSPHLDRVLELPEAQRGAYLAALRGTDVALAAELESLLDERRDASRDSFLERAAPPLPLDVSLAGQRFGAYTLDALVGQGGMGNVWLAHRSDGRFEGKAAVKLLNASRLGSAAAERFRREGQVLARLADPHIARLVDAGISSSGQPYLVLEYVDGEPIDAFCDARRLGVEARLRLFLEVLEAVAHAHANLIVHRDIKPSNVLVERNARARLLDFGIAKLLEGEGEAGGATALTREAGRALTPEFAAPEQVSDSGVTTATDVYALGTLLYLLLTGRHPAESALRSPAELVRWIAETAPEKLSDAVDERRSREPEERRRCARDRSTTPEALGRLLRGDLDTIVARCLKKRPEERYASVTALADDVRRFLRHEPIGARPDTLGYRAAKFVRRHRWAVAAALLVASAAAAGTAMIVARGREARRQRDAARAQLARATAANEFLSFLLSTAAPAGRVLSRDALLEQGEALAEKQYAGDASLRSEMLATIGQQYASAEDWQKALPVLSRAAGLASDAGSKARTLCALALAEMASGRAADGRATIARALANLPAGPEYALPRSFCLCRLAEFGYYTDEAEAMVRNARASLAALGESPVGSTEQRLDGMAALAYGYYLSRQSGKADAAYSELLAALEAAGRERTTAAADTLNNWALVHLDGDLVRAEPLMRRSLELRRSIEGDGVAPTVLFNYASILYRLARYGEARPLYEKTIRTARERAEHRIEVDAIMELADMDAEGGDLPAADADLRRVDPSTFRTPVFNTLRQAHYAYSEGVQALARGEAGRARDRFAASTELFAKANAKFNLTVFAHIGLARAELAVGHREAALAAAREALEVSRSFVAEGAPSFLIGHSLLCLGEIQNASGDGSAAAESLREASAQLRRTLGDDHPAVHRAQELARRSGASS